VRFRYAWTEVSLWSPYPVSTFVLLFPYHSENPGNQS
jgi:hypothetical protein